MGSATEQVLGDQNSRCCPVPLKAPAPQKEKQFMSPLVPPSAVSFENGVVPSRSFLYEGGLGSTCSQGRGKGWTFTKPRVLIFIYDRVSESDENHVLPPSQMEDNLTC